MIPAVDDTLLAAAVVQLHLLMLLVTVVLVAVVPVTCTAGPAVCVLTELLNALQTRDQATQQLQDNKKSAESQWTAAQKQYQKASPSNQKASKKAWNLAEKARDEVAICLVIVKPSVAVKDMFHDIVCTQVEAVLCYMRYAQYCICNQQAYLMAALVLICIVATYMCLFLNPVIA